MQQSIMDDDNQLSRTNEKNFLGQIKTFMLQSTHNMANLNQNEIWAVLCSKRQYKQHDGEKWLCEILHIAGLYY